jgi:hypothetical protein
MARLTGIIGGVFVAFIVFGVAGFIGDRLSEGKPAWVEFAVLAVSVLLSLAAGWSSYAASVRKSRGSPPAT